MGGDCVITLAATFGNATVLQRLITAAADLELTGRDDLPPLLEAVPRGHTACVNILLRAAANPNIRDTHDSTALHLAAINGIVPVIPALLSAGAHIDACNADGNTALILAVLGNHPGHPARIVQLLLEARADAEHRNNKGETVHSLAIERNADDILQILNSRNIELCHNNDESSGASTSTETDRYALSEISVKIE